MCPTPNQSLDKSALLRNRRDWQDLGENSKSPVSSSQFIEMRIHLTEFRHRPTTYSSSGNPLRHLASQGGLSHDPQAFDGASMIAWLAVLA